jgi:hypothetical protein
MFRNMSTCGAALNGQICNFKFQIAQVSPIRTLHPIGWCNVHFARVFRLTIRSWDLPLYPQGLQQAKIISFQILISSSLPCVHPFCHCIGPIYDLCQRCNNFHQYTSHLTIVRTRQLTVSYWGSTNIRLNRTKFSRPAFMHPCRFGWWQLRKTA